MAGIGDLAQDLKDLQNKMGAGGPEGYIRSLMATFGVSRAEAMDMYKAEDKVQKLDQTPRVN